MRWCSPPAIGPRWKHSSIRPRKRSIRAACRGRAGRTRRRGCSSAASTSRPPGCFARSLARRAASPLRSATGAMRTGSDTEEERMRKLIVFNSVSLDGYFTGRQGDMSWAHKQDKEWNDFVAGNASGEGELVFGRVTYEMMASYWPTSQARKDAPAVAGKMNDAPKIVFSHKMKKATWKNTRLIGGDIAA